MLNTVVWNNESGPMEPVDFERIVSRSLSKVKTTRRRKSVVWDVDLSGLGMVIGNKAQLHEASYELIMNAYESLDEGGTITIETPFDSRWNIIRIKDDGEGMNPETLQNCLDPFFTTKIGNHQGLGLTVTKGIIDSHSGKLEIESDFDKGTTVTVKLPKAVGITTEFDEGLNPDILFVAPSRTANFFHSSLIKLGWAVDTADNTGEAVRKIRNNQPKTILVLPGAGSIGEEGVRQLAWVKKSAKLILFDPSNSVRQGIKGIDAVIRGSYPMHHLIAIINGYLSKNLVKEKTKNSG
jgi:anti-sigma regulatory factor (Ser/Thr protein kinase)